MTDEPLEPPEQDEVSDLAARAEQRISRRAMLAKTGRRLALPILCTFLVSKEAMAMSGSCGPTGGMMRRRRRR